MAVFNITITITTPTGVTAAEAVNLLAENHGYRNMTIPGVDGPSIPNPETKAVFVKRQIAERIGRAIRTQRIERARKDADEVELAKPPIIVE